MHDEAIETTMTVEKRTIDHIPVTERHGKARDLFTIWFGSPYQGLVPSGMYGLLSRHSFGVAARLPGTSAHG